MVKIGRNDSCYCNSGKKYKKCCESNDMNKKSVQNIKKNIDNNKYSKGQIISSEIIHDFREVLQEDYTDHTIIDITDDISLENYREYQVQNYSTNIIMLAEKIDGKNHNFFIAKSGKLDDNMIIMYRGSYRIFNQNDFLQVYESIQKMITTRLAGLEDK
jgi:hypothetical protein